MVQNKKEKNKKLFLISLGCPKNLVDSEVMLGVLEQAGYETCQDAQEAELILVNTCGFIRSAVEEAVDEILQVLELKKEDPEKLVVVTGCLVQRYGQDLSKELPDVDLFIGTDGFADIVLRLQELDGQKKPFMDELHGAPYLMDSVVPRRISTPVHRAYLKITEGCSNRCAYCMIPSIRGKLRSRTLDDLLVEAKSLEAMGVKELTLVGQDLTAFGFDLGPQGPRLSDLIERLIAETTIPWIRMLYLYPNRVTGALLEVVASEQRLVPYFDIPLQHVSLSVLKAMRRPYVETDIVALLARIRSLIPQAAIRSTFIVGFPGETEADVDELAEFLKAQQLNHVGVFAYSNEDGCAAAKLPNHCSDEVKEERLQYLMELQADISAAKNKAMIGKIEPVLVEGLSRETDLLLEGRTCFQAPEIDGCVYINSGSCEQGDIVNVKFTEAHVYDLVGEIVS